MKVVLEKLENHFSLDSISEKLVSGQWRLATQVNQQQSASKG